MTLEAYRCRVNDKAFGSPELSILLENDLQVMKLPRMDVFIHSLEENLVAISQK